MKHSEFLSRLDDEKIVSAIAAAERKSSGEIRVFISRKIPRNGAETLALAQETFPRLGMRQTRHRNGVLLFFAAVALAVSGVTGVETTRSLLVVGGVVSAVGTALSILVIALFAFGIVGALRHPPQE